MLLYSLGCAGIAMGGFRGDATIETTDIVIQNDMPSKNCNSNQNRKTTQNSLAKYYNVMGG